jgi:hypothetical protein
MHNDINQLIQTYASNVNLYTKFDVEKFVQNINPTLLSAMRMLTKRTRGDIRRVSDESQSCTCNLIKQLYCLMRFFLHYQSVLHTFAFNVN